MKPAILTHIHRRRQTDANLGHFSKAILCNISALFLFVFVVVGSAVAFRGSSLPIQSANQNGIAIPKTNIVQDLVSNRDEAEIDRAMGILSEDRVKKLLAVIRSEKGNSVSSDLVRENIFSNLDVTKSVAEDLKVANFPLPDAEAETVTTGSFGGEGDGPGIGD